jgi:hypothetical protein
MRSMTLLPDARQTAEMVELTQIKGLPWLLA